MIHELKPVEPPFQPQIAELLARYPHGKDGYIIQLFRVFANSRRFLDKKGAVNLLDIDSPLALREREIVILRTTANLECEYEWGVHVGVFARAAQFTAVQVAATRLGSHNESCWTASESLLLQCVDELCLSGKILDGTYERFQKQWNLEQQLEILALCGNYHTISFVANSTRLPNEVFGAPFPIGSDSRHG